MLSGKRFRFTVATLAIETTGIKKTAVIIPEGEIIEVIRGPRPDDKRMVDVKWNGRTLVVFAEDVMQRGEYLDSQSAGSS